MPTTDLSFDKSQSQREMELLLEFFKRNFLCFVQRSSFNGLQFLHKLRFERFVVGVGPRTMLCSRLRNRHFEIKAATTNLTSHLGSRKFLDSR